MSLDLLGPASTNAVTIRPGRSITRAADDTWLKDCTNADSADGTALGADFFNDMLAQLRVAMRSSGIVLDNADDMLWRAMQSTGLRYAADTGAANHLTAAFTPPVGALAAGLALLIKVGTNNTGAVDVTANATATKSLKWPDGTDLVAGDIKAGGIVLIAYDGVNYQLLCRLNSGAASTANFVPGQIIYWPMATPPTGTLECDGSAVSRATYARLFGIIGTTHGVGNGTTTFNLPDYRGEFLRGWDHGRGADPYAGARTNRGDGVVGDFVGTKQASGVGSFTASASYSIANPMATINAWTDTYRGTANFPKVSVPFVFESSGYIQSISDHGVRTIDYGIQGGQAPFTSRSTTAASPGGFAGGPGVNAGALTWNFDADVTYTPQPGQSYSKMLDSIDGTGSIVVTSGSETRPRNVNVLVCIAY